MATEKEQYNEDELTTPDWLNVDFLLKVLKNSENGENVEILSHKVTPGTAKGDHYGSVMFRVVVQYILKGERKSKSLIIKTMPQTDGQKKELLGDSLIFETEIGMYTEVLPKFQQILKDVGDDITFCAKCVYYSLEPNKLMVFEDLLPQGFTVLRNRFLDLQETKLVYEKLAKWHALSYKIGLENPSFFDKYRHGVYNQTALLAADHVRCGLTNFLAFLDTQPNLLMYKKYFEPLKDTLVEKCRDSFEEYRKNPQENVAYVLAHGDFHGKNLMFKLNAQTNCGEDVRLLDFQFSFFGSWALDLIYGKYFILASKLRSEHADEMLHFYYKHFEETLQKIGFTGVIPKYSDLQNELLRNKHFELFLIATVLPMWYYFMQEAPELEVIMTSNEHLQKLYQSDDYIQNINALLPQLKQAGYFE